MTLGRRAGDYAGPSAVASGSVSLATVKPSPEIYYVPATRTPNGGRLAAGPESDPVGGYLSASGPAGDVRFVRPPPISAFAEWVGGSSPCESGFVQAKARAVPTLEGRRRDDRTLAASRALPRSGWSETLMGREPTEGCLLPFGVDDDAPGDEPQCGCNVQPQARPSCPATRACDARAERKSPDVPADESISAQLRSASPIEAPRAATGAFSLPERL